MARVEGLYWVRERDEGELIIAAFRAGDWTFGDGETFDDERNLTVVAGPLEPPDPKVAATWKHRYDQILGARKRNEGVDPTGGWDYLDGYYWVRIPGRAHPVLAQYLEGWGAAAGVEEFSSVEVVDGPLIPPHVTKQRIA
jgi:hypothetical protein